MSQSPLILALDLASVVGFAIGRPSDPIPVFGSFRCAPPQASLGAVYHGLSRWLVSTIASEKISLLVFEAPIAPSFLKGKTSAHTARVLIGLCAIAEEIAFDLRIECREAQVRDVRAHFIGGNFKRERAKALTIEACKRLGWNVRNDNEADSCALWNYQCSIFDPKIALRASPLFQRRVA